MPTTVINQIIVGLIKTRIKSAKPTPVSADRDHPVVCPERELVEHVPLVVELVPLEVLAMVEQALAEQPPVGDMVIRDCLEVTSSLVTNLEVAIATLVSQVTPTRMPVRRERVTEALASPELLPAEPMRTQANQEVAMETRGSPQVATRTLVSPEVDTQMRDSLEGTMQTPASLGRSQAEHLLAGAIPALPVNEDLGRVGPEIEPGVILAPELNSKIKKNAKD